MKYYYQIIPLVRLPLTKSNDFTYHSDKIIKFGSIVKINLNNKIVRGVVISKPQIISPLEQAKRYLSPAQGDNERSDLTKPVLQLITPAQITKQQLGLAKLISKYYLTPLSTTLKFFAFKLTKNNNPKYFENLNSQMREINENKWQKKITLTKKQREAIKKIVFQTLNTKSTSKNNDLDKKDKKLSISDFKSSEEVSFQLLTGECSVSTLLFGPPASGKTEVVVEVIKATIQKKRQALVLIPEIFLSYQEIVRYSSKFIKETATKIAILHSQLKPSEITTIWNGVRSGRIKIVISTRMGIFLPFKKLGLIIVDEEQDISHKQWDTPPFYHTRQVVELMQKIYTKTQVLLVSSTPSLESWHKHSNTPHRQIIKLPILKTNSIKVKPPEVKLIDLKKYYKKNQQIFISNELRFALKNCLDQNTIAILLVPRRGKSSTIICQDCREIPTCPNCQVPLVHSESNYRCLHCNFKISNISKCPHCGSFRLQDVGFGTESVADNLQNMFPSAKVAIADNTTFADNDFRRKILKKLYNNELDFLVGTYGIAKGLDIQAVNLVAILNADNWPGQTDFRFDENYLSTIFQLAGRVNRPGGKQTGQCLIQTFDPTNRIFTYLKDWDWPAFVKYELKNRKSLSYPPFTHLLKITYRNYDKEVIEKELDKLYKQLEKYTLTIRAKRSHKASADATLTTRHQPIPRGSSRYNAYNEASADPTKHQPIQLLPPYFGYQEKLRGYWQKYLLLKIKTLPITDKKLLKILDLPTNWKIDVDTENIF